MENEPKLLVLPNGAMLISIIEEVGTNMGEPDCKLITPYIIKDDETMEPWLMGYTTQTVFMIHSDKILTITTPRKTHIEKYTKLSQ